VKNVAWLVTNGYGSFWIEIEPPRSKGPLLKALATAGWTRIPVVKETPRTLLVKSGHDINDELSDKERTQLIRKAERDLRSLGITDINQVDRGI
jgi:hypothetical protein